MRHLYTFLFMIILTGLISVYGQSFLTNIPARKQTSLNGKWQVIIDPVDFGKGSWAAIYKDKSPTGKTDFYEYSFSNGPIFDVPGDFNSQLPELKFYESTVWYKKTAELLKKDNKRQFLYFDAVNYTCDIYFNSEKLGSHEGGFTPFQFEITDLIINGNNSIIVRVNNERKRDGVPAEGYDWFNYGGITRDVRLVEVPLTYIDDYFIQLQKKSKNTVNGYVKLQGLTSPQTIKIEIPEANIVYSQQTNDSGYASINFKAQLKLWSPENPKLYEVNIISQNDTLSELIGFRNIETKGDEILLNGESVFLKGINFHEEVPQQKSRAWSETDARILLTWAKELGCNFIRTAHYPQNENIVRLAEQMGFMIWEEIPVFQSINFGNESTVSLIDAQLKEMLRRDKNRCGIIIWSVSNETRPGAARTKVLTDVVNLCRSIDNTRLVSTAFNNYRYDGSNVYIEDSLIKALDVIGVNEYIGWYKAWPSSPKDIKWHSHFNKPLIMSEFGGEALYGLSGPSDIASSWSEEYQEQLYKDQLTMLENIPFLRGCCPWTLADFRSPRRLHPVLQNGWNRKGLLSEKGERKKAWYIMHKYYQTK